MDANETHASAPSQNNRESDRDELETQAHRSSTGGELEVRCPDCHASMDVAVDTHFTDLTCASCGSHFSLVDQSQATRMAPPLSKMGRFELIERLGVGGFGSVWKARDKELDRTVAIKIPRQGGMTAEEQEKFFREARAAAQLRHPNIVVVHEVGRDGDSVYIVSDFVRGVTLGDWLTGQQLTSREAADLCANIADALHHAHEHGIVHRDLKPANIIMDGDGEPHLMDFGLARRDAGEVTVTMDGQVVGTPAYMSPEQAEGRGHDADRRSDVYSLGVILFQLLTGELPFRGNARMLMHQVINDEPPSPRKLNANVAKDLETITLKCLEKDPSRRYHSAAEMAAELKRFLAGEPIQARPLGGAERTWRWVKRNPRVAALTASVGVLLVAIAAMSSVGFAIAKKQQLAAQEAATREFNLRQQAELNLDLAKSAVDTYLTRVADDDRLKQGDFNKLRTELLQSAIPFYEQFAKQKPGEAKSDANQANAYARLASIHGDIGKPDLSAREYEQAIAIQKRLVEKYPDAPTYQRNLANHEAELGWNLHVDGKYEDARPHYEAALAILSTLAARFPNEPDHRYKLARAHEKFGMLLRNTKTNQVGLGWMQGVQNDKSLSKQQFEHAITLEKALLAQSPNSAEYQSALASSSFYLGVQLLNEDTKAAKEHLTTAVEIQRKLTAADPRNPEYRAALSESLEYLGRASGNLIDKDAAKRHFDEGIEIQKQVVAEFPSVVKYRIILAAMHSAYGDFLNRVGDPDGAFHQYELFAAEREKQAADFPNVANVTQIAVNAHNHCVMLAERRGDKLAVAKHQKSVHAIWTRRLADVPNDYNAMQSYAVTLINSPNPSPDERKRAVEIAKKACELTNYENARMVETLGIATWTAGDLDAAMNHLKQVIALYEQALAGTPHDEQHRANLAYARGRLAGCMWEMRDLPAACDQHQKALELLLKLMTDFPGESQYVDSVVWTHQHLGDLFDQREDFARPLNHREQALKIYDAHLTLRAKTLGDLFRTALGFDQRRNDLVYGLSTTKARQQPQQDATDDNQSMATPVTKAARVEPLPIQPSAPVPDDSDPLADPFRLAE